MVNYCRLINVSLLGRMFGVIFAILFLSGNFSIIILGLPIEIRFVIMVFAISALILLASLGCRFFLPRMSFGLILSLGLVSFLIVTSSWSSNFDQAAIELDDLIFMLLISILALVGFQSFPGAVSASMATILTFALVYSVVAIATSIITGGRGSILVGGPNVATRVMFFGIISLLYFNALERRSSLLFFIPIIFAGIISIGSRGGIVGASMALLIYFLIGLLKGHLKFPTVNIKGFVFLVTSALLFAIYLFPYVYRVFESRVLNLLVNRIHFAGRDSLYSNAWDLIQANPVIGYGLGGYYGEVLSFYPHNILLQLWLDGGVLLVLNFLILVFVTIRYLFSRVRVVSIVATAMLYMLIVQQFSGGYYDFRYYFFFWAILVVCTCSESIRSHRTNFYEEIEATGGRNGSQVS